MDTPQGLSGSGRDRCFDLDHDRFEHDHRLRAGVAFLPAGHPILRTDARADSSGGIPPFIRRNDPGGDLKRQPHLFFWVWNYFRLHPPSELNEYLEAGTISLIYAIAGLLVWTLVNHLRSKQTDLARSLIELETAKERLLIEEKLAAVGRFSTAIAHEIRNPVAMISSAMTTAFSRGVDSAESQEMFDIAAKEASRLEKLTTDFLAYARPRSPVKERADVADSIAYIADVCRPRGDGERAVAIHTEICEGLWADIDGGQLQQALLNLAMNAIEASPSGAAVVLRVTRDNDRIRIEIENSLGPIPADAVGCIFEPFFTTKPSGTGLGLAIAHSIVLADGGELVLSRNEPDLVQFSVILPFCPREAAANG